MAKRAGMAPADEEKWPKPWCQVNELEPEQVTSTVATETISWLETLQQFQPN